MFIFFHIEITVSEGPRAGKLPPILRQVFINFYQASIKLPTGFHQASISLPTSFHRVFLLQASAYRCDRPCLTRLSHEDLLDPLPAWALRRTVHSAQRTVAGGAQGFPASAASERTRAAPRAAPLTPERAELRLSSVFSASLFVAPPMHRSLQSSSKAPLVGARSGQRPLHVERGMGTSPHALAARRPRWRP